LPHVPCQSLWKSVAGSTVSDQWENADAVCSNCPWCWFNEECKGDGRQEGLTIFLCGKESSSCLRTGSGFSNSYGSVPWTQAWKSS
jgi:hypothetical protein